MIKKNRRIRVATSKKAAKTARKRAIKKIINNAMDEQLRMSELWAASLRAKPGITRKHVYGTRTIAAFGILDITSDTHIGDGSANCVS